MKKYFYPAACLLASTLLIVSCSKDKTDTTIPAKQSIRTKVEYSALVDGTKYDNTNTIFVDSKGASTIDLTTGNFRYRVFQGINTYAGTWKTQTVDAAVLKNMYANTGSPFTLVSNPAPADFAALNASGVQLRSVTAGSLAAADAEAVRTKIESDFTAMATASVERNTAASKGIAGFVTNAAGTKYLVDAKGFEVQQIIQKGLIGAFDLDYISNVLLVKGLEADNYTAVSGKIYTKLEQNWDEAYGSLTLNPIYLAGSTDAVRGTSESFLGSYIWEYNKANYAKIYPAFLKGRAAIVNNDAAELKTQATFIRNQMELAIAAASLGYLDKWKTGTDEGTRAHAIGEGLGFVYSLRFATLHGADKKFSDDILTALVGSTGGYWDLTNDKINAAAATIKAKFGL
jgi:hypothetical protein